jgi:hypothetical protein
MAPKKGPEPTRATSESPVSKTTATYPSKIEPLINVQLKLEKSASAQITNGFALVSICVMAFAVRLFSVIKYESVIHEFDPYFNYRVTQYLTKNGFYDMWNWFDDRTWYPLGRVVGGTVYPVRISRSHQVEKRSNRLSTSGPRIWKLYDGKLLSYH